MAKYKITASMDLKPIISEAKDVAQALIDFSDRLTEIDKKYSGQERDCENCKDVPDMNVGKIFTFQKRKYYVDGIRHSGDFIKVSLKRIKEQAERDCENCKHQKKEYNKRMSCFVVSCDSWECNFEVKENKE